MKIKMQIFILLYLFNSLMGAAQTTSSSQVYTKKDSLPADPAAVLIAQANAAFNKEDYSTARSFYQQAVEAYQKSGDKKGRADAVYNLARIAVRLKDYAAARKLYEESLVLKRELGDKKIIATCLFSIGQMCLIQKDYPAALQVFEESLTLRQAIQDAKGIGWSLNALGVVRYINNEYDSARSLFEQSYSRLKEIGDKQGIAFSTNNLANVNYMIGNYSIARSLELESLQTAIELNHKVFIATSLAGLGAVMIETGKPEEGTKLLGACDALLEMSNDVLATEDQRFYDCAVKSATVKLGKKTFDQGRLEGQKMTMEQAIEYAEHNSDK